MLMLALKNDVKVGTDEEEDSSKVKLAFTSKLFRSIEAFPPWSIPAASEASHKGRGFHGVRNGEVGSSDVTCGRNGVWRRCHANVPSQLVASLLAHSHLR